MGHVCVQLVAILSKPGVKGWPLLLTNGIASGGKDRGYSVQPAQFCKGSSGRYLAFIRPCHPNQSKFVASTLSCPLRSITRPFFVFCCCADLLLVAPTRNLSAPSPALGPRIMTTTNMFADTNIPDVLDEESAPGSPAPTDPDMESAPPPPAPADPDMEPAPPSLAPADPDQEEGTGDGGYIDLGETNDGVLSNAHFHGGITKTVADGMSGAVAQRHPLTWVLTSAFSLLPPCPNRSKIAPHLLCQSPGSSLLSQSPGSPLAFSLTRLPTCFLSHPAPPCFLSHPAPSLLSQSSDSILLSHSPGSSLLFQSSRSSFISQTPGSSCLCVCRAIMLTVRVCRHPDSRGARRWSVPLPVPCSRQHRRAHP